MSVLRGNKKKRRGVAVVFTAVSLVALLAFASLAIDVGLLYTTRAELQSSADAAALAGAQRLIDESRFTDSSLQSLVFDASRLEAADYAYKNKVLRASPLVDSVADVTVGHIENVTAYGEPMSFADADTYNAVHVIVRRNETRNGPVSLLFARIFGFQTANLGAEATAAFPMNVSGFETHGEGDTISMLPFAVHIDAWNNLINGIYSAGDTLAYSDGTRSVSSGSDGYDEISIYPPGGLWALPEGNFGTIDIGSAGNSADDIARQIVDGISDDDLSYVGGTLEVPMDFYGDTGLSAGVKEELASIIGQPRIIPLFDTVEGSGNNAQFHVVAWAGCRIMSVQLTGPNEYKHVIIQPAAVSEDSAIEDPTAENYLVFGSARLVK